tara:strand:+ start:3139 stop:5046 length:1908 start_codon:yes stop_codon:yes gene_type:complete
VVLEANYNEEDFMVTTDVRPVTLSPQSEVVAKKRYYLKEKNGQIKEDATKLFKRVAKAVAAVEPMYGTLKVESELSESEFYSIMANLEFLPNSPTLMNAGTGQGTYSACFVLPLEDSMEGIMQASTNTAMVQKFGGGTGFALSSIRPRGEKIKTTHGIACGPIEVLKTLSRVSSMITQGGKRDGANMAIMSIYHPDILEFISCKSVEGDIHNFNISVGVDSNWMKLVEAGADYNLINPYNNTISGTLNAREVFNKITEGAWKNGEPGMVFLDRINEDNHVMDEYGPMVATNPCGEQPLLGNESCNLGSINLDKFFIKGKDIQAVQSPWKAQIDWERLEQVTRIATRFLDNVIDANEYATPEIEQMTKATRKIGLGVMGFADLLIQLRIAYNSAVARDIGSELIGAIKEWADDESLMLGAMRGPFPAWERSSYDKETEAYRNNCRLTVAPTGTISMLADCSSGIEPSFALVWKKQNILEGQTLNYANKYFEHDAKEHGFQSDELMDYLANGGSLQTREDVPQWAKNLYLTAPEIAPEDHVLMQAAFQQHVDSGISKTINFDNSATVQDVEDSYKLAWRTGCKGITVYRAGSRDKEVLVKGTTDTLEDSKCCEAPQLIMQDGCQSCKTCGWSACLVA